MLKRTALLIVVVALVGAADTGAHTTSYPSAITFDLFLCTDCNGGPTKGPIAHDWVAAGDVSSAKAACVPGRKVKLYAVYTGVRKRGPSPPELLDIDRTSESGAWSGRFTHTLQGVDHLEARLVKRNIGPQGHSHLCEAASVNRFLVT